MAAGDRVIFALANRESLKYRTDRDYGVGAVCLKDGMFYEANADIPAGTVFTEGDTGATWVQVGGKETPDWDIAAAYKAGDKVYTGSAIWEANEDIPANTTWAMGTAGATWKLKSGIFSELNSTVDYDTDNNISKVDFNGEFTAKNVATTVAGTRYTSVVAQPADTVFWIGGLELKVSASWIQLYVRDGRTAILSWTRSGDTPASGQKTTSSGRLDLSLPSGSSAGWTWTYNIGVQSAAFDGIITIVSQRINSSSVRTTATAVGNVTQL